MSVILPVYNAYLNRGGEDEVFDAEAGLLEAHGHTVLRIRVEADELRQLSIAKQAQLAVGTVWSRRYYRQFYELATQRQPDIVHFHNTFPLISPSAYVACQHRHVPVVQTLHNYRLICPNVLLFRDGHPCEDCLGRTVPWPGVAHACYHGSRAQTATVAAMLTAHRLRGTWQHDVDRYIALTEFSRQKFIAGGLPPDKIAVKPNFLAPDPGPKTGTGDGFLFVGRLAENKGIGTLLKSWSTGLEAVPLRIAGDGPLADTVHAAACQTRTIDELGRLPRPEIIEQMHAARALIFPSIWYEAFPVTLVEAFACGLPVIASRLGAMAEIVEDGKTGLLFEAGNADDLAAKVRWAWEHPAEMRRMGEAARREYEAKYTAERNYDMLMEIYQQAIEHARRRREKGGNA